MYCPAGWAGARSGSNSPFLLTPQKRRLCVMPCCGKDPRRKGRLLHAHNIAAISPSHPCRRWRSNRGHPRGWKILILPVIFCPSPSWAGCCHSPVQTAASSTAGRGGGKKKAEEKTPLWTGEGEWKRGRGLQNRSWCPAGTKAVSTPVSTHRRSPRWWLCIQSGSRSGVAPLHRTAKTCPIAWGQAVGSWDLRISVGAPLVHRICDYATLGQVSRILHLW